MRRATRWHGSGQAFDMQFVNIHTHHEANDGSIQLINHPVQKDLPEKPGAVYSVGLHPWDLEKLNPELMLEKLAVLSKNKNVLAIGECGLDQAIDTDFEFQERIFRQQIELAEGQNKPLILHAVKSYPDLIRIKKTRPAPAPWILHGYNGTRETSLQLLRHDCYFSFGPQLLKGQQKLLESIQQIPIEKLFFETDDSSEKIKTIYTFAAPILGLTVEKLQETVFNNYHRIFGNG
jgi:TatD DNase family protein